MSGNPRFNKASYIANASRKVRCCGPGAAGRGGLGGLGGPQLTITAPSANADVTLGKVITIEWTGGDPDKDVSIYLQTATNMVLAKQTAYNADNKSEGGGHDFSADATTEFATAAGLVDAPIAAKIIISQDGGDTAEVSVNLVFPSDPPPTGISLSYNTPDWDDLMTWDTPNGKIHAITWEAFNAVTPAPQHNQMGRPVMKSITDDATNSHSDAWNTVATLVNKELLNFDLTINGETVVVDDEGYTESGQFVTRGFKLGMGVGSDTPLFRLAKPGRG